jgi:hypothetical protein
MSSNYGLNRVSLTSAPRVWTDLSSRTRSSHGIASGSEDWRLAGIGSVTERPARRSASCATAGRWLSTRWSRTSCTDQTPRAERTARVAAGIVSKALRSCGRRQQPNAGDPRGEPRCPCGAESRERGAVREPAWQSILYRSGRRRRSARIRPCWSWGAWSEWLGTLWPREHPPGLRKQIIRNSVHGDSVHLEVLLFE